MEKKAKSSGILRRTFFRLLGVSGSKAAVSCLLKRRYRSSKFSFPVDAASVKEILLILPDRHLEVLYQLRNVISLVSRFKNASATLLCEQSVAQYFKMIPGLTIIEYLKEEREAFSVPLLHILKSSGTVPRFVFFSTGIPIFLFCTLPAQQVLQ